MALSPVIRSRLETQGFVGLTDTTLAEVEPWLRLSPALCTVLVGVGTVLPSPTMLWVMAVIAVMGALLPFHPFDVIYNAGIRFLVGTGPLPRNGAPRRFACGLATVWLVATALAFGSGATTWATFLAACSRRWAPWWRRRISVSPPRCIALFSASRPSGADELGLSVSSSVGAPRLLSAYRAFACASLSVAPRMPLCYTCLALDSRHVTW